MTVIEIILLIIIGLLLLAGGRGAWMLRDFIVKTEEMMIGYERTIGEHQKNIEEKITEYEKSEDIFLSGVLTKTEEKVTEYEETITVLAKQIDDRDEFIAKFAETIYDIKRKMHEIDSKEMFVSDDEVGFVYKAINKEIQRLYDFAKKEEQDGEKTEE